MRVASYASASVAMAIIASASGGFAQETQQAPLPPVTVTAPAPPVQAPYLTNPGTSYQRNPYAGRYRVEEDKFPEVPCNVTRIAAAAGGKCLQGYRLTPGLVITMGLGPIACDMGLDVVIYNTGNLSIEADTLIVDPYKLTAIGYHNQNCYINGYTGYDQQDFQDMNQVTRRGTNWRNLVDDGEDKSIEFSDGPHNCVAVKKRGQGGEAGMFICCMRASAGPTPPPFGPKMSPTCSVHCNFANTTRSAICASRDNRMQLGGRG